MQLFGTHAPPSSCCPFGQPLGFSLTHIPLDSVKPKTHEHDPDLLDSELDGQEKESAEILDVPAIEPFSEVNSQPPYSHPSTDTKDAFQPPYIIDFDINEHTPDGVEDVTERPPAL